MLVLSVCTLSIHCMRIQTKPFTTSNPAEMNWNWIHTHTHCIIAKKWYASTSPCIPAWLVRRYSSFCRGQHIRRLYLFFSLALVPLFSRFSLMVRSIKIASSGFLFMRSISFTLLPMMNTLYVSSVSLCCNAEMDQAGVELNQIKLKWK